jgi:hypothetical protein
MYGIGPPQAHAAANLLPAHNYRADLSRIDDLYVYKSDDLASARLRRAATLLCARSNWTPFRHVVTGRDTCPGSAPDK